MKNILDEDPVIRTIETYSNHADEFVKKTYSYDSCPILQKWASKFIELLNGKSILDVGFGSGRDLLYFESKGFSVTGIDLTKHFIDNVSKLTDSKLLLMDMRNLNFNDNSFHGIWCCSSFFHLQKGDALSTLTGFRKILTNNGILYMSIKEGTGSLWRKDEYSHISEDYRYFSYYTINEISELLQKSGFNLIDISTFSDTRPFRPNWLNIFAIKSEL